MPINLNHTTATFSTDSGPLTIGIDSAVRLPVGAQSARPTGLSGHLRFDTDTNQFEGFDGTQWGPLAGSVSSTTDVPEGSNLYFTNERVDDRVANLLVAGTNITITYDDGAGTLTIDTASGGLFKGDNGEVGSSAGDIFRVNGQTLNTNVTIDADENASATGPLAIATGVTLTVTSGGNLSIV